MATLCGLSTTARQLARSASQPLLIRCMSTFRPTGWDVHPYTCQSGSSGVQLAVEKFVHRDSQPQQQSAASDDESQTEPQPGGFLRKLIQSKSASRHNGNGDEANQATNGNGDGSERNEISETARRKKVFFAHANGYCRQVWYPVIQEMEAAGLSDYEAVAFDFRMHGDSQRSEMQSWWSLAHDVLAVVNHEDAIGEERQTKIKANRIGVGHSMGGAAMAMAEYLRPGTFSHLVLIEPIITPPPYSPSDSDVYLAGMAEKRQRTFSSEEAAIESMFGRRPFARWDPLTLDSYLHGGLRRDGSGQLELKCNPKDEAALYLLGSTHSMWEHLASLLCPVLVISGGESTVFNAQKLDDLTRRFPRGRQQLIEGSTHYLPMEQPAIISHLVAETTARLSPVEKLAAEEEA